MRSDALRRRQSLLRAARQLLAERGREVPLEAVSEAAGVGIATLYRNFASREELVHEVTLDLLADLSAVASAAIARLSRQGEETVPAREVWAVFVADLVELDLGALTQALAVDDITQLADAVREAQAKAVVDVQVVIAELQGSAVVRPDITPRDLILGVGLVTRRLPEVIATAVPEATARIVSFLIAGMSTADVDGDSRA